VIRADTVPHNGDGSQDIEAVLTSEPVTIVRRTQVEAHVLPDQSLLLFDSEKATAIPVNAAGRKVWEMCDGAHTIDQLVDSLAALYDAERTEIDRDTRGFLAALLRHGLVDKLGSVR
jgi:Coenzyme PQQ synthesis protein D (PqqD)